MDFLSFFSRWKTSVVGGQSSVHAWVARRKHICGLEKFALILRIPCPLAITLRTLAGNWLTFSTDAPRLWQVTMILGPFGKILPLCKYYPLYTLWKAKVWFKWAKLMVLWQSCDENSFWNNNGKILGGANLAEHYRTFYIGWVGRMYGRGNNVQRRFLNRRKIREEIREILAWLDNYVEYMHHHCWHWY